MFGDDDDAEESSVGATRYPVMPSLVGMQQMRTRLHMAQLGRKLMKWTSVATASELRRIASDIQEAYKTFAEDLQNAFLLLARSRYFFPELNKLIIEDIQRSANITVTHSTKTVSGVRILQYRTAESEEIAYKHLGLGRGGVTINEARIAWKKLLMLQIRMAELRTSFITVENVHKSATNPHGKGWEMAACVENSRNFKMLFVNRRMNILNKIVIPKVKATMKYILLELEEMEREELFRIKQIQVKKKKHKEGAEASEYPVRYVDEVFEKEKPVTSPPCPAEPIPPPIPVPESMHDKLSELIALQEPKPVPRCMHGKPSELITVKKPIPKPQKKQYKPICCTDKPCIVTRVASSRSQLSIQDYIKYSNSKLEQLRNMLDNTICLGQDVKKNTRTFSIDECLKLCKDAKLKLEKIGNKEKVSQEGSKLATLLEQLKGHIKKVISVTRGLRDVQYLSPSVTNFVENCEKIDDKLNIAVKDVDAVKSHLSDLKDEIEDVLKVMAVYKEEGLLSKSVENFAKVCDYTKSKIEYYTKQVERSELTSDAKKLDHLKSHVSNLETLTTAVKQVGVKSISIDNFLSNCKDFKAKLDQYKNRGSQADELLSKLMGQIDETVNVTKVAKKEGLLTESVENFIKSCETFKSRLEPKSKDENKTPVNKLSNIIQGVMDLIGKLRAQGLVSQSMANLLKTCEETKTRFDIDGRCPPVDNVILSPESGKSCTCQSNISLCETCRGMYKGSETEHILPVPPLLPLCETCAGIEKTVAPEILCDSCAEKLALKTPCDTCAEYLSWSSEEKAGYCGFCKPKQEQRTTTNEEETQEYLGSHENNIKRISKITRFLTENGDIREEKVVTSIKKCKHDTNETDIDSEDPDISCESCEVELCLAPNQNQMGFTKSARKSKSEQVMRVASLTDPRFRQSVSFSHQIFCVRNPSQILLTTYSEELISSSSSLRPCQSDL